MVDPSSFIINGYHIFRDKLSNQTSMNINVYGIAYDTLGIKVSQREQS